MTREQLVALIMAHLIHAGIVTNAPMSPMRVYSEAALQIVTAAESAVAQEKGN